MAKSNFYSYVAQLKTQAQSKNPAVAKDAAQILATFDQITKQKSGKEATRMTVTELKSIPFDLSQKSPEHLKYWGSPHGNFLGFFGKKNREKRKKFFKGIGDVVKKVARLVASPLTLPLLPFKKPMKRALNKQNVSYKNDVLDIAKQFYKHVVQKSNYEGYESYYLHIPTDKKGNLVEDVASIIKAIINFFKKNKEKIEKGVATAEEILMEKEVEESHKELEQPEKMAKAIREDSFHATQKNSMDTKSVVMYAIVAIVALKVLKIV